MCVNCIRFLIANHTDPATGTFKGIDLSGPVTRPVLPERQPESVTARNENLNLSPNEYKPGTAVPD